MRLIIITQYFPPERGPVRDIYNIAQEMSKRGHQITVVCALPNYPAGKPYPGYGKYLPKITMESGVRIIRTPVVMAGNCSPILRIIGVISFALSSLPWLLFAKRPDLIVATIPSVAGGLVGLFLSQLKAIPLVIDMKDVEPLRTFLIRNITNRWYARYLSKFFIGAYNRADKIVVPIEDEKNLLLENGVPINKIKLISHNIDVDEFLETAEHYSNCFQLPRKNNRFIALYMGTIGKADDHESLITAFGSENIRTLPVDLVIIGDGECTPACLNLINKMKLDNVFIFQPVALDWVPNILLQSDLLVCTLGPNPFSRGSKFYEYLAAAKPILANSGGILERTIKEIGNGWAVNARETGSLEKALCCFLALSQTERKDMGRRGREFARKHYNSIDAHNSWENLFKETITS
jgi:colanic acid biosynthesis glycosyl transferase WcaI